MRTAFICLLTKIADRKREKLTKMANLNWLFNFPSEKDIFSYLKITNLQITVVLTLFFITPYIGAEEDITFVTSTTNENAELVFHQIEGKVTPPDPKPSDWYWATRILVDGGKKLAFLKVKSTFNRMMYFFKINIRVWCPN